MGMKWSLELPDEFAHAKKAFERLKSEGSQLRMPHSKPLHERLFELRFKCGVTQRRVTYHFDKGRKVITLTTFIKQKNNEDHEIRQ